jgi:hypothetical protein
MEYMNFQLCYLFYKLLHLNLTKEDINLFHEIHIILLHILFLLIHLLMIELSLLNHLFLDLYVLIFHLRNLESLINLFVNFLECIYHYNNYFQIFL